MTVSAEAFEKLLDKAVKLQEELAAERERADALAACIQDLEQFAEDSGCDMCNPAMINAYKIRSDYEPHLAQRDARVAEWVMKSVASGKAPAQVIADIAAGGGHE